MLKKKKKKKKLTKLQQEFKNVKDVKAYLTQESEARGVYGIKDDFNSKFFIWLLIILVIVAIVYFTDTPNTSNVDDCAGGGLFPNFKLCHCYTEQEIANNPKIYKNCF